MGFSRCKKGKQIFKYLYSAIFAQSWSETKVIGSFVPMGVNLKMLSPGRTQQDMNWRKKRQCTRSNFHAFLKGVAAREELLHRMLVLEEL